MSATTTTNDSLTAEGGERARALSVRWIIGARDDLVWFIGSVVTSYLLLALYVGGVVPLVPMVVAWAVLVDAPHVFGTFSRTYFDREERRARRRLLWLSLLFFAVGPLAVLVGAASSSSSSRRSGPTTTSSNSTTASWCSTRRRTKTSTRRTTRS